MAYVKIVDFKKSGDAFRTINKKIRKFGKQAGNDFEDILLKGVNDIRTDIIKSMKDTKRDSSKSFKRGKKIHRPSKKGNPPAIDTGELVRSIIIDARKLTVEIGATAKHGEILELEKDRPWLQVAVDRGRPKIEHALMKKIQELDLL